MHVVHSNEAYIYLYANRTQNCRLLFFRWRNAPALNVKHGKLLFRPHNGVQFSSTNIRRKNEKSKRKIKITDERRRRRRQ